MKVAIVDYGVGNLPSVAKALTFAAAVPERISDPALALASGARALVIPGVGHFASTCALDDRWRATILGAVARGVPVLGICLGMQWLFDGSAEEVAVRGLGLLNGQCAALTGGVKIPHVGWNTLERGDRFSILLEGIDPGAAAYFTHSFAAPVTAAAVSTTAHGTVFASTVEQGAVFGVQWHPEKSGPVGLAALRNFVAYAQAQSC